MLQEIITELENHASSTCLGMDKRVVFEPCTVVFAKPSNYAELFVKFDDTPVNTVYRDRLERS